MIGDIIYLDKKMYTQVNDKGTLERLPSVGFWSTVYIEIRHHFKPWTISDIRVFCNKHSRFVIGGKQ